MTWADEIDKAGANSGGMTSHDVISMLRSGDAMMFVCDDLHGSIAVVEGKAHVLHMAGKWTDSAGDWIISRARDRMREVGLRDLEIYGRPGWRRFLQRKGYL